MTAEDPTRDVAPPGAEAAGRGRRFPVLVLLPVLIAGALFVLFYGSLMDPDGKSDIPSALIDKPVPPFELPPVTGLNRDGVPSPGLASTDLAGRVTVINVWASWCVPCRQEHPILTDLAKDPRIRLVGINYKDEPENAVRFLGQLGNPYAAVGADIRGRVAIDWGVYGVPETFVVAADGRIAYKHIGPISPESLRERLIPEIEKALARPS
jgi:cytochrome c biogenesis protein CcmG/thiol:disulfide interchange protein DsbE